jgi:hypothetical protein
VVKWAAGGVLFAVLATANAAGYRYGTSDQAFYIPVVVRALDDAAFPRDRALIDAQGRLMLADEVVAAAIAATGVSADVLFFAGYLLSLTLIWAGLVLIGRSTYTSPWLIVALGAAFTLRHRIPRTSANSFEPYFHPRMLAFGLGALAVAAVLRRRDPVAIVLVAAAAVVHITTAMWFGLLVGVALAVLDVRWRRLALAAAAAVAMFTTWALVAGPLQASLTRMDAQWLEAVAGKDSLFASQWPLWAWAANLGLLGIVWWAHGRRRSAGVARPAETALAWGATALVLVFLITFPAVVGRVALPVQLQISRVFWLVDFVALVLLLGVIRQERTARAVAIALLAISAARGAYVMAVEHPERELFAVSLDDSEWHDAMAWMRRQPTDAHVLADPGHAWRYGTSVRVSAERDVFVEDVKDSAVAIYSRDVAMRYTERMNAIGDFGALTPDKARALAQRYGLDFLVTETALALPEAYRNRSFLIYDLRAGTEGPEETEAEAAEETEAEAAEGTETEGAEGTEFTTEERRNGERAEDSSQRSPGGTVR